MPSNLDLSGTKISIQIILEMATTRKKNDTENYQKLQQLDMSNCHIDDNDFSRLMKNLRFFGKLSSINLSTYDTIQIKILSRQSKLVTFNMHRQPQLNFQDKNYKFIYVNLFISIVENKLCHRSKQLLIQLNSKSKQLNIIPSIIEKYLSKQDPIIIVE